MKPSESEETPFYGLLEVNKAKLNVDTPYGKWNFGVIELVIKTKNIRRF